MEDLGLNRLFGGTYVGRRVLVTGHTGFKGSWLTLWLRAMGAQVIGLSLDPDTSPSHWSLLDLDDVVDYRMDLRNAADVRDVLESQRPEMVFHLAAQPLVRRSYREPASTFDINVTGLVNLLEAIRSCPSVRATINATTDKVYADHADSAGYRENDALGGHDPYSSSKACAEIVSACYRKSFFNLDDGRGFTVRLATARAGNVIGGGDWAEDRLVPDLVRAGIANEPLKVRNPTSIRPWQHVLEPLSGYLRLGQLLFESESFADAWNFGPDREGEMSVQELVHRMAADWPSLRIEHDDQPCPHEAKILRLNCDKAKHHLAWHPVWDSETTLSHTSEWYREFHQSGKVHSMKDLARYIDDARAIGLGWTA